MVGFGGFVGGRGQDALAPICGCGFVGEVEEVVGGVTVDGLLVEGVDVGAAAGAGEVGVEDDDVAG